jgi:glycosyltransferase involved in cell wall biosynthesis
MADRPLPFVSVVVPVLNGERTIGDCLTSLLRAEYSSDRREIVVVDNGSRDATADVVARFPVRLVREPRRSRSHARNRGVAAAEGEIVAFTDADCAVTSRWLVELVSGFDRAEIGGVAGEAVAYPPETAVERYLATRRAALGAWAMGQACGWIVFVSAAVRREAFERVGGLDPLFPGGADIDFSWRLRAAGFEIAFRPQALAFHRHPRTVRALVRQRVRYGRGHAALARRYADTIGWGWRREAAAWRDLAASAGGVAAAAASALRRRDAQPVERAAIDLALKLGERAGFVAATLRAPAAAALLQRPPYPGP